MSATSLAFYRSFDLPWTHSAEQEQRFRRIQLRVLAAVLLLSLLMRLLPTPALPPALFVPPPPIQLVLDQRPPLPPAPPPPVVKAQPPAVLPPVAAKPLPPRPLVKELAKPAENKPGSAPPGPTARERAIAAGAADLASGLSSLHDSSAASKAITGRPDLTGKPNPNFTSDLNGGQDKGPGSERSLITAKAGQASGGINTAAFSRGTGGGGLAGRGTTQVTGYGGGGTGTGPGLGAGGRGGGGNGTGTGSGNGTGSGSGANSRSREEIEMIFDQNKGAIYALYNRALREIPGLQGKMVLRLTILPSGVVSACEVVSSELKDPDLERRLVQRVLLFKFEARDVATTVGTKPIDFFPSSAG